MKIGIQTNAWSAQRHQDLDGLLADIAAAGYDGFEIGAHRIDLSDPRSFSSLVDRYGLQVAGIHTHGELFDPQAMQVAMPRLAEAVRFAAAIGSPFVMFSGKAKEAKSETDLQNEATALQKIGELCQGEGVALCYHNHYWEIEHDFRELDYLCNHTDPAVMGLALDIGWVYRAGQPPAAAVVRFLERIRYFHFKDFRIKDTQTDTWTELGNGYVDFPGVLAVIRDRDYWLTFERDEVMADPLASAKTSRAYLQSLGY